MSDSTEGPAQFPSTSPPASADDAESVQAHTDSAPLGLDGHAPPASAGAASDLLAEPATSNVYPAPQPPPPATPAPVASTATAATAWGGAGPTRTGPKGKTRSPFGGWLLLIPTLGIYYLFWYFNINRELRDYDPSIKVSPGWAVVSLFIPIVGLISIYNTGNRIRQAQATAGAQREASGLLGLITSIFLALDVPYYSSQLNKVWQHAHA